MPTDPHLPLAQLISTGVITLPQNPTAVQRAFPIEFISDIAAASSGWARAGTFVGDPAPGSKYSALNTAPDDNVYLQASSSGAVFTVGFQVPPHGITAVGPDELTRLFGYSGETCTLGIFTVMYSVTGTQPTIPTLRFRMGIYRSDLGYRWLWSNKDGTIWPAPYTPVPPLPWTGPQHPLTVGDVVSESMQGVAANPFGGIMPLMNLSLYDRDSQHIPRIPWAWALILDAFPSGTTMRVHAAHGTVYWPGPYTAGRFGVTEAVTGTDTALGFNVVEVDDPGVSDETITVATNVALVDDGGVGTDTGDERVTYRNSRWASPRTPRRATSGDRARLT